MGIDYDYKTHEHSTSSPVVRQEGEDFEILEYRIRGAEEEGEPWFGHLDTGISIGGPEQGEAELVGETEAFPIKIERVDEGYAQFVGLTDKLPFF